MATVSDPFGVFLSVSEVFLAPERGPREGLREGFRFVIKTFWSVKIRRKNRFFPGTLGVSQHVLATFLGDSEHI